jgi:hypothetical protein
LPGYRNIVAVSYDPAPGTPVHRAEPSSRHLPFVVVLEMIDVAHWTDEPHTAMTQRQYNKSNFRKDNDDRRTNWMIVGEGCHLIASAIDFFLSCFFCMRLPFAVSFDPRIAPIAFIVP